MSNLSYIKLPAARFSETFDVDIYIDLPNICKSLKRLACSNVNYADLVGIVVREFARDLHSTSVCPTPHIVVCRSVYCFTSIPINFHTDDLEKVVNQQKFLTALRLKHGFTVYEIPLDFHGHHINNNKGNDNTTTWQPHEKGLDVSLAMRLIQQCISPNRPAGIVIASGDADYVPVLTEITTHDPPIRATVAAFAHSLSQVYLSHRSPWENPIILDRYLSELVSDERLTNHSVIKKGRI